tara:strand:- start:656 stop:1270 length:615 start_codon:yes stop_codon:yes gene_type:complete
MINKFVSIVELPELYNILHEINSLFSFEVKNFKDISDFIKEIESNNHEFSDVVLISKKNKNLSTIKKIDTNCLILLDSTPVKINSLIETINIQLIKKKYNSQSQIHIKNYTLNLNSRTIFNENNKLKLTEREIEVILYLGEKNIKHNILDLQKNIWGYSIHLETHTVETHIYRLRKKISDKFNDENFILSHQDGYFIDQKINPA